MKPEEKEKIKEKELQKLITKLKGTFKEKGFIEKLKKDIPEFKENENLTVTPKEIIELYHEFFDMFIEQVIKVSVQYGDLIERKRQKEFDELKNKIESLESGIEESKLINEENKELEDKLKEKDKEIERLKCWKCRMCGSPNEHLKEIHTFQCTKCGYKEWYPERIGDYDDLLGNKLKEKDRLIDNMFSKEQVEGMIQGKDKEIHDLKDEIIQDEVIEVNKKEIERLNMALDLANQCNKGFEKGNNLLNQLKQQLQEKDKKWIEKINKIYSSIIKKLEDFYEEEQSFVKQYPESKGWKTYRLEAIWECILKLKNLNLEVDKK